MFGSYSSRPFCGCWYLIPLVHAHYQPQKQYLPQVDLSSSTQILATTSRTTLTQTFINPSQTAKLDEVQYTFPLYDGVSVVGFQCTVGSRTIVGVVKEKQQAKAEYKAAVARGETAGLLTQLPEASDVFTTKIGNVPAGEKIIVEIVYLGELKHDAETDGSRFTIPTFIAPRYGGVSAESSNAFRDQASDKGGIRILIDVIQEEGSVIRGLQSPSHPIAVTMGRTSSMHEDAFDNNHASATLTLGSTELDKDFVVVVLAKGQDTPRALLETHSSISDQRAIMTTLVPKFSLPNIHPEIVFVVDRSGSMDGNIPTLVSAMRIFLKSLPVGVKFNICSFGSSFSFLFKKSKSYDQTSMQEALNHLNTFSANFGGTELLQPVKATVENRFKDMQLEVMVITDGEIWNQTELFDFINNSAQDKNVRFFSLGIGDGASSSLVEGIARAGDGFAQFVGDNEKMDKRVVRMLKGALTPHIKDYSLEIKYSKEDDAMDEDFEIVESVTDSLKVVVTDLKKPSPANKVISLFNTSTKETPTDPKTGRYDHLPTIATPKILQAPHKIPPLYPFNRTTVYLLLSQEACSKTPVAVVLRAKSEHGPLELEIPIQNIGYGQTIHQLAAKKAVHELEEGRGWITQAKTEKGILISTKFEGRWDEIVEREAVRLGVQFQVGGKWCSFVAVEKKAQASEVEKEVETAWEMQEGGDKNENEKSMRSRGGRGGMSFGAAPVQRSAGMYSSFPAQFVASSSTFVTGGAGVHSNQTLFGSGHAAGLFGSKNSNTTNCFGSSLFKANCAQLSAQPTGFNTNARMIPTKADSTSEQVASFRPLGANSIFGNSNPAASMNAVASIFTAISRELNVQNAGSPFGQSDSASMVSTNNGESSNFFGSNYNYTAGTSPATSGGLSGSPASKPGFGATNTSTSAGVFGQSTPTSNSTGTNPLRPGSVFGNPAPKNSALVTNTVAYPSLFAPAPHPPPPPADDEFPLADYSSPTAGSFSPQPRMSKMKASFSSSPAYFPVGAGGAAVAAIPAPGFAMAPSRQMNDMSRRQSSGQAAEMGSIKPFGSGSSINYQFQYSTLARPVHSDAEADDEDGDLVGYSPEEEKKEKVMLKCAAGFSGSDISITPPLRQRDRASPTLLGMGAYSDTVFGSGTPIYSPPTSTPETKMHTLIALQAFDGSWTIEAALLKLLGVSKAALMASNGNVSTKVVATLAAIAFLELKVRGESDVWEMVVEKARAWVAGNAGSGSGIEGVEERIRTVIGA